MDRSKNNTREEIAIPESGNLCIIRLYDMGIPYSYFSLPPQKDLSLMQPLNTQEK